MITPEEEDRIRRDESEKWLEAIDRHALKCPGVGGECKKYIADERLEMRLKENPNLPPDKWWP